MKSSTVVLHEPLRPTATFDCVAAVSNAAGRPEEEAGQGRRRTPKAGPQAHCTKITSHQSRCAKVMPVASNWSMIVQRRVLHWGAVEPEDIAKSAKLSGMTVLRCMQVHPTRTQRRALLCRASRNPRYLPHHYHIVLHDAVLNNPVSGVLQFRGPGSCAGSLKGDQQKKRAARRDPCAAQQPFAPAQAEGGQWAVHAHLVVHIHVRRRLRHHIQRWQCAGAEQLKVCCRANRI